MDELNDSLKKMSVNKVLDKKITQYVDDDTDEVKNRPILDRYNYEIDLVYHILKKTKKIKENNDFSFERYEDFVELVKNTLYRYIDPKHGINFNDIYDDDISNRYASELEKYIKKTSNIINLRKKFFLRNVKLTFNKIIKFLKHLEYI